ncbi:MAG: extracellular solute-binding protein [Anaerolineae bacterium]|nr:extracellular solute-binding protein [Anaerolineae bacterium]
MRLRILLCSIVALTLMGCAVETETPTAVPDPPAATTRSATPVPTALPEVQPIIVTLRLWVPEDLNPYGSSPGADIFAQQLTEFSDAYPDIQVEVVVKKAHGRGGLVDFLRTARDAAPSVLPDLLILDAAELKTAAGSGLLQPLDNLLSPALAVDRFPFAIEMGQVQTQTMGFVLGAETEHLAYRPIIFESPVISWTQIISSPEPYLFPAGRNDQRVVNDATLIQYLAAGGRLSDAEGNPVVSQEALLSVFGFYSDCLSTGVVSPTNVLQITDSTQAWQQFKAGYGGLAVVPSRAYWVEADETMAFAPMPTRDGELLSTIQGWTISLVATDPSRQQLSMLLLDWLIAHDHNGEWTQATGYLPGTRGALQLWGVSGDERVDLANILNAAIVVPSNDALTVSGAAIQDGLEALLRGRAGPQTAMEMAVDEVGREQ